MNEDESRIFIVSLLPTLSAVHRLCIVHMYPMYIPYTASLQPAPSHQEQLQYLSISIEHSLVSHLHKV